MYYYGHYYNLMTTDNDHFPCRSVLEITTEHPSKPKMLLNQPPDAVVVMMNPGSSEPEQEMEPQILNPEDILPHCRLVPARPDDTQGQIVEIIRRMNYSHIRVLNLSDIREPKSSRFFQTICQGRFMQNNHIQAPHSIFSQNRLAELQYRMNPRSKIIIAGWGKGWSKHQWRRNIAERCYYMIRGFEFRIIGYQDDNTDNYIFLHPIYSRIRNIWPDCIVSQICADLRNRNTGRR